MKQNRIRCGILCLLMVFAVGCAEPKEQDREEDLFLDRNQMFQETTDDTTEIGTKGTGLEDDRSIYEEDDDTSVVTMYLTVSTGNESENTNHTWEEVNQYSTYYYKEHGIERYGVNGLLQVGDENGPKKGELGYGKKIPNAIVTVRGQTSSRLAQKNYKIKLKDEKGTFREQSTINLNKHMTEGLRFRNKLCYDLLKQLPGTISFRTQFVHLYVKDTTKGGSGEFEDYGLYTQVEQPNKRYLEKHGFDKNGQFYKINFFEFYQYEDIIRLKSDAAYDPVAFEELLEIQGNDDHSKLIAMLKDVNDKTISTQTLLKKWFDEDNLASWMAFHIIVGNDDTQSRNTLIYSPKNDNHWYFISWDNDVSFLRYESEVLGRKSEKGWEDGISNYWGNVLFQRLLKDPDFRKSLDDKISEYRSILTQDKMQELVNRYKEVVKPYVYGEHDRKFAPLTEEEYDRVADKLPEEIERNYQSYRESLEKPMPFFIGTPTVNGSHIEIQWNHSYDFKGETITYSFELAKDPLMNEVICQEEDLLLPEYQYQGMLEPGQYFVRIIAKNKSGKTQPAFDYYVMDSEKQFGILCFYVSEDGKIEVDTYDEADTE